MYEIRAFAPFVSAPAIESKRVMWPVLSSGLSAWLCGALLFGLVFCLMSVAVAQPAGAGASGASGTAASAASATAAAAEPSASVPGQSASSPDPEASKPVAAPRPVRRWASVPRVFGRLTAADLGIVINEDDPYSVAVGAYYAKARRVPPARILRVKLPVKGKLSRDEFEGLSKKVNGHFGPNVQALALAWRQPYAVECNSITGALTMGFDGSLCGNTCAPSRRSTYFGSQSARPLKDHQMRLSMLLASRDVESAKALIDRGVQSDGTLGLRGGPPVRVHFVTTGDAIRSQRQVMFPPPGMVSRFGIDVVLDQTEALRDARRVLIYMTGRARVDGLDSVDFVPGALADHLTSFGGILDASHDQMPAQAWLDAGATASYGTTSEPCAHLQKFPNPQALLLFYVQGATALEAYWKSVLWPQQGLFIGEPLAAPFAR